MLEEIIKELKATKDNDHITSEVCWHGPRG